jgi:hypothetical protein
VRAAFSAAKPRTTTRACRQSSEEPAGRDGSASTQSSRSLGSCKSRKVASPPWRPASPHAHCPRQRSKSGPWLSTRSTLRPPANPAKPPVRQPATASGTAASAAAGPAIGLVCVPANRTTRSVTPAALRASVSPPTSGEGRQPNRGLHRAGCFASSRSDETCPSEPARHAFQPPGRPRRPRADHRLP